MPQNPNGWGKKKKDYCGRERNRIWRKWDNHNQLPRLYLNIVILIHHLRLNQGFVIMDGTIIWSLMCTTIMLFLDISLKSILFSIIINTRLRWNSSWRREKRKRKRKIIGMMSIWNGRYISQRRRPEKLYRAYSMRFVSFTLMVFFMIFCTILKLLPSKIKT